MANTDLELNKTTNPVVSLDNWAVVFSSHGTPRLWGIAYHHPKWQHGTEVRTSGIVSHTTKMVTTKSGSNYMLLNPNSSFVEMCNKAGLPDPNDGICDEHLKEI